MNTTALRGTLVNYADRLMRSDRVLTKFALFNAMASREPSIIINGIACRLTAIMREDGSGSSFILHLHGPDWKPYTTYCRTID